MFSKQITTSDAFVDMPLSSQVLYFHLGMEADDDGFVSNPKRISKMVGSNDDDLKILLVKRFLLSFESGVLVIKHHRINNNWDKHNCKRTKYLEEFYQLNIKENGSYTLDKLQGVPIQSEFSLKTDFRIEENRREYNPSAFSKEKDGVKKNMKTFNIESGEYEEETKKTGKNTEAIKLAQLFDKMASDYIGKRIITPKSYFIVINAINKHKMKPKGLEAIYKDWFNDPKTKDQDKVKLSFALSANNINSWKTKN